MNKKTNTTKKVKQIIKGQNIRFTTDGHARIVKYCKEKGYNIGAFCEKSILRVIDYPEITASN